MRKNDTAKVLLAKLGGERVGVGRRRDRDRGREGRGALVHAEVSPVTRGQGAKHPR